MYMYFFNLCHGFRRIHVICGCHKRKKGLNDQSKINQKFKLFERFWLQTAFKNRDTSHLKILKYTNGKL